MCNVHAIHTSELFEIRETVRIIHSKLNLFYFSAKYQLNKLNGRKFHIRSTILIIYTILYKLISLMRNVIIIANICRDNYLQYL